MGEEALNSTTPTTRDTTVLIVGAGMTGSVAYHSLKASGFPVGRVSVWEKARGFGGRMSVAVSPGITRPLIVRACNPL